MRTILFVFVFLTFDCAHNDPNKKSNSVIEKNATIQREEEIHSDIDPMLNGKMCDSGTPLDCYNLGLKEAQNGNHARAELLYKQACAGEELSGCAVLGAIEYQKGNLAEVGLFYKKSCEGGYIFGCGGLAFLEYKKVNLSEARLLFKQVCNAGNMISCFMLGYLEMEKGNLVKAR